MEVRERRTQILNDDGGKDQTDDAWRVHCVEQFFHSTHTRTHMHTLENEQEAEAQSINQCSTNTDQTKTIC